MNTSLRRFILVINALGIFTTPYVSFCGSSRSSHYSKKLSKEEVHSDAPSVGGILLTLAGIGIGIGALFYGLGELFKQSDESLYESCKQRCNQLAHCYDQEHNLGFYNAKKLAHIIVKNSSCRTNHFLYYKEKLDCDIAQIQRDSSNVRSRISALRGTLNKQSPRLNHHEYVTVSSMLKRLERLYENQCDLLEFLENLLAAVCTMPEYRQEERDRKKERERAWDRFERNFLTPQPKVVYVPETSIHLNFRR
jgi:hypothetical protein